MLNIRKYRLKIFAAIVIVAAISVLSLAALSDFAEKNYEIPILMYHAIDYNYDKTKLSVSPKSFERQMKFLRDNEFNILFLKDAIDYISGQKKAPPNTVVITMDDGFYNIYEYAFPVIKKYKTPVTVFVVTDWIGKKGFLGWKELREMADTGLVDVGSHSETHTFMTSRRGKDLEAEILGSKQALEKGLGRKVATFCYPMGNYDALARKEVKDAGYSCAVATNPGALAPDDDVYVIKRIKISPTSDNMFVFWIKTGPLAMWIRNFKHR